MNTLPPLGLLLDVDGPIASPVTRTIAIPSIVSNLVVLANLGVPVIFNTGRSDAFIRDVVVKPLLAAGLSPDARVYGVCEKGAVWFGATMKNFSGVNVDESVAIAPEIVAELRAMLESLFTKTMFWDFTKRAMVSVEQRTDVASADYLADQKHFDDDAFAIFEKHGVGVVLGDRRSTGEITVRIDPTIISTDIESVTLGKDLGAERALELLQDSGDLPRLWRTVGDSRSDYAMADYLHSQGYDVAHVDVRPADGIPVTPYRVITEGNLIHDEAGAAFLAHWVRELG
ncbi:MAG: hypothetical protein H7248_01045 [Microbacteriaceae bacterium]|nr:hypothetical protein [Microbacteriaceae bacterium]